MTVGDIAECLDKTPGQVAPALIRLAEDGYLRLGKEPEGGTSLPVDCGVVPTSDALRMLPAFEQMSKQKVEAELEGLTEEE